MSAQILIDDRVGSRDLAPMLPNAALTQLEFADAMFAGVDAVDGKTPVLIGVERKRLHDMLTSLSSGRLAGHQLIGLREHYDTVYVIVEGQWDIASDGLIVQWRRGGPQPLEIGKRRWTGRELGNFCNTLQVLCGVHVIYTFSARHTAQTLQWLCAWWQKPKHSSHRRGYNAASVDVGAKVSFGKPKSVEMLAALIPGVGSEKAAGIAEVFKTPVELMCATEGELREVDGIGKVLAKAVVEWFGSEK